jgi:agmatine/peptidylarginine deiminase
MPPRLPAEWEPQAAVMLTWPHGNSDWADDLPATLGAFTALAVAISHDQPLLSVVEGERTLLDIRTRLLAAGASSSSLTFAIAASDDAWARDHGPLTVIDNGRPVLRDFDFNGWGGKFEHGQDNGITRALVDSGVFGDVDVTVPGMVLEGGAIETDGERTLLATRSSVMTESRNPGLGVDAIEARLKETLGFDRFLWLNHGTVSGDDTDGHIDTLVRFADPQTLLHVTAPKGHPDHNALDAMVDELKALRQRDGRPYRLIPLPCPGELVDDSGRLLPRDLTPTSC